MSDYAMPGLEASFRGAVKRARKRAAALEDDEERRRRRTKGRGRRRTGSRTTPKRRVGAVEARELGKLDDEEKVKRAQKGFESLVNIGKALTGEQGKKVTSALRSAPLFSAGAIGLAIAAGLAAYGLTAYVIRKLKDKKEGREQLAFEVSRAYRQSRVELEERQGRPLSRPQQDQLASAFKQELKKLGLTTTELF